MLEDVETGDIVCPLVYLREVFGLNYSRKTSNDRTRVIHEVPDGLIRPPVMTAQNLLQQQLMRARQQQMNGGKPAPPPADPLPCWKLPFESSTDVKLQIRNLLGDEGFSKGHVRLVSLPLAFNVLSEKDEFRDSPLFRAVHHVLKGTSYAQLLRRKRPALKEDGADDEVAMNGDSNAPVGVPNNEGLRMNSFNASTTDFVLVDCVPPPCAGVTVKIEAATAPGENDAGGSHASLKKVSSGRKNEALKGPRDMQKSFDKYVDYITPDNMTKSGARSGSSRGTAGDNGEGLRGNSFTGPSRAMPPPAAQEPSMLGGGADMSVRMVLDQDGRFSKMRRVSNTSTSPGGSGGWIGADGQICVDPMETRVAAAGGDSPFEAAERRAASRPHVGEERAEWPPIDDDGQGEAGHPAAKKGCGGGVTRSRRAFAGTVRFRHIRRSSIDGDGRARGCQRLLRRPQRVHLGVDAAHDRERTRGCGGRDWSGRRHAGGADAGIGAASPRGWDLVGGLG